MTPRRSAVTVAFLLVSLAADITAGATATGRDQAIKDLVQVERDFAALSVQKNWRDAFRAYFSDDGVWFTPNPERTKPALAAVPESVLKDKVEWFATRTEASQAGDLGFNTGPYRWTNPDPRKPVRQGYFFTIWKRQPDGHFKVAVDFGARSNGPALETERDWRALGGSPYVPRSGEKAATADDLKNQEAAFTEVLREEGLAGGYARVLDREATLLRDEKLPMRTAAAIREHLSGLKKVASLSFNPEYAAVASSGDLGYTYGSYTIVATDFGPDIISYYAHVWRRDAKGEWKLLFDVANAPAVQSKTPRPVATPKPRP
jgi:ketosteroid isomerase-like protein